MTLMTPTLSTPKEENVNEELRNALTTTATLKRATHFLFMVERKSIYEGGGKKE